MMALRCLTLLFSPMKSKKIGESLPFILKIVPVRNGLLYIVIIEGVLTSVLSFRSSDSKDIVCFLLSPSRGVSRPPLL